MSKDTCCGRALKPFEVEVTPRMPGGWGLPTRVTGVGISPADVQRAAAFIVNGSDRRQGDLSDHTVTFSGSQFDAVLGRCRYRGCS